MAGADLVGGISLISSTRASGTTTATLVPGTADRGAEGQRSGAGDRPGPRRPCTRCRARSSSSARSSCRSVRADPQQATLQRRAPGTTAWTTVTQRSPSAAAYRRALPGHRLGRRPRTGSYRVAWAAGTAQAGLLHRHDPSRPDREVQHRGGDGQLHHPHIPQPGHEEQRAPKFPGEAFRGLYTTANMYFPYAELVTNIQQAESRPAGRLRRPVLREPTDRRGTRTPTSSTCCRATTCGCGLRRDHPEHADDLPGRRPRRLPPEPVGMVGPSGTARGTTAGAATSCRRTG